MLKGKLVYSDKDIGDIEYTVYARDTFKDTRLFIVNEAVISGEYEKANYLFDKQEDKNGVYFNPYEEGYIEHKAANGEIVSIPIGNERRLDIKKTSKYKSNITNREFCLRVSSFIRYMQITGRKNYNEGMQEDMGFKSIRDIQVEGFGYIKYNMGIMVELVCSNKFVSIELKTVPDDIFDIAVFGELKAKDRYDNILSVTPIEIVGFKLHKDILGFEYTSTVSKEMANVVGVIDNIEDVIANNPDKNTDWILSRNYVIVNDDMLDDVIQDFLSYDGVIAFDTETTGLNINFKSRVGEADQLVGVVLSKKVGQGYYFPLQHKLFTNLCGGDHWYFMEKYMRKILESKKIICHNVKFDWKVAYIYDIVVNCVYDTMIALGVTKRYEEESYELGLKSIIRNIFGLDMFELDDFIVGASFKDSNITFADLPYELVRRYACADGDMTLYLYENIEKSDILNQYNAKTVFELEVWFAKAVGYSEFYGYHVDVDRIPELVENIESSIEYHRDEMFKVAGREFNPNSPKQLMGIMYDELGIEQIASKRSTNKDTLRALLGYENEDGSYKYPFAAMLKNYRDSAGIHKNFLKRLPEFTTDDGFIFSEVMQLGTVTGRCSVKDPNYQSYNDVVKKYITPRQDFWHVDSDFSQIEYKVLASMAGQESLIEAFDDPDLDYHSYQAARMFSIPYAAVTKELRQQSKAINFGLPYGMGDSSLGARIFGKRSKENTTKAANLRRKFFIGQEKIQRFFEVVRSKGVADGFTSTYFGRRRYYHRGLFSVPEIRRQAGNHVIQGTAADIYKYAVVRLFRRVIKEDWLGMVLFNVFVHDELLIEVHKSVDFYKFIKAWREEFEVKIEGFCRLTAGVGFGDCWYNAKNQDLPPMYVDEIIKKYVDGETVWKEDIGGFMKELEEGYKEYKINRVKGFILDPNNRGEVIKPAISTLLVEVVKDKLKGMQAEEVKEILGYDEVKGLKDSIKIFCYKYGINYDDIDIKLSGDVVPVSSDDFSINDSESFDDMGRDEFAYLMMGSRGFFGDVVNSVIYLCNIEVEGLNIISYGVNKGYFTDHGDYAVKVFLDPNNFDSLVLSGARLTRDNYSNIKDLYLAFAKGGIL